MAQVKNEEEKKKETTKKAVKKTTSDGKTTGTRKKTTSKASTEGTTKKQTATKKNTTTSKKVKTAKENEIVDKKAEGSEEIKKVEKAKTKKEPKTGSTKKASASKNRKKNATDNKKEKTTTKRASKTAKTKGKITKIIGSRKPEELVEDEDDVIITDAKESSKDVVKFEDEQKMQLMENEVKKDLKSKTKLPKEEERKLSSVVFENLCVAIAIMIYLFFIILGFINIKEEVYVVDLKVFSFIILVIAILLFERAYKKDSGRLCAFGIETLFLSIATMGLLYANIEINNIFLPVAATVSLLFAIYYVAKSIYLYSKMKKKFFVDNMKDIIQKEEKE